MTKGDGELPEKVRRGRRTISDAQLLDAALELFLENGFERTSIDAIAGAAGMAKRTIYSRFAGKTDLFLAAMRRAIALWAIPAGELAPSGEETFEETLLRVGRSLTRNVLTPEGARLMRIAVAEAGRLPEIGNLFYWQSNEPALDFLMNLFGRVLGGDMATYDRASMAAHAYLHLVVGGPANSAALGLPTDPEIVDGFTRLCVRIFLEGVRALDRETGADDDGSQSDKVVLLPAPHRSHAEAELRAENQRLRDIVIKYALEIEELKAGPGRKTGA